MLVIDRCSSENDVQTCVNFLESTSSTLVEDTLGLQAIVLIEVIGSHACSERSKVLDAVLLEDGLSG